MRVALDFDGTLVDTMPELELAAMTLTEERYGSELDVRARYRETVGASFREQLEEIFPGDPQNDGVATEYRARQATVYARCELCSTTRAALRLFELAGAVISVCSSTEGTLAGAVLGRLLPSPRGLTVFGREFGTKDEQVRFTLAGDPSGYFIGDAPRDAEYARRGHARFLAVEHTFTRADFAEVGALSVPTLEDAARAVLELDV